MLFVQKTFDLPLGVHFEFLTVKGKIGDLLVTRQRAVYAFDFPFDKTGKEFITTLLLRIILRQGFVVGNYQGEDILAAGFDLFAAQNKDLADKPGTFEVGFNFLGVDVLAA